MDNQIPIIDDDKGTVKIISIRLERTDIQSDTAFNIKDGLSRIKELFARAIHQNSARRNGYFVVVDCSVLLETP